jgi:hypothetical protein
MLIGNLFYVCVCIAIIQADGLMLRPLRRRVETATGTAGDTPGPQNSYSNTQVDDQVKQDPKLDGEQIQDNTGGAFMEMDEILKQKVRFESRC